MPDLPLFHASERVDKVDLAAVVSFPRDLDNLLTKYRFVDRQSRIVRGFRIELPDQNQFPGRVVIHGGFGMQYDGQHVFNEDQLNVSRTVTLVGSGTTFYVEVEFVESESDVDARAFWDPTVEQGADISGDALPDGQEFSANVSTRKTPDWQIVTPISTIGFSRDQIASLASNRIPIVALATDGSNKITVGVNTNLSVEKANSTMIRYISTTQIVVREPWLFQVGETINITDDTGTSSASISAVSYETGLLTISIITPRVAGAVVQVTSVSSPNFIVDTVSGRYRRMEVHAVAPNHVVDWRDMFFQGDEVHGTILGKSPVSVTAKSDLNLQSLKDYVDFLSAQIQELKWGIPDPYTAGTDSERTPAGIATAFPSPPHYFDRAGGVACVRGYTVTIGDGTNSFGDFNGTTDAVFTAAVAAVPTGGTIHVKNGTYTLGAIVALGAKEVTFVGQGALTVIRTSAAGYFTLNGANKVAFKSLKLQGTAGDSISFSIITVAPRVVCEDVDFVDSIINVDVAMDRSSSFHRCIFQSSSYSQSLGLITSTAAAGHISGTFSQCVFNNANGGGGSSIFDTTTNNSGFRFCYIMNSTIDGAGGVNILIGSQTRSLNLAQCVLTTSADDYHIQMLAGGSGVWLTDCTMAADKCFGTFAQASGITVRNCRHAPGYSAPNKAALKFMLCSYVQVLNNELSISSSSGDLVLGLIEVLNNSGLSASDYLISGNKFFQSTLNGKAIGVKVYGASGTPRFDRINITDNNFSYFDVGVFFGAAVTTQIYHLKINGNIIDNSYRLGIATDLVATTRFLSICNNAIDKVGNSGSTEITGQEGRRGISIVGLVEDFVCGGNVIQEVGDAAVVGYGLAVAATVRGTITGNTIRSVVGSDANGMRISGDDISVSSNMVSDIVPASGTLYGISLGVCNNISVIGNVIYDLDNTSGTGGSFIGCSGSPTLNGATISGNTIRGVTGSDVDGITPTSAALMVNATISNNSIQGSVRDGITVVGDYNVVISGNTINGSTQNAIYLLIDERGSITGNTIYHYGDGAGEFAINVVSADDVVVSSNSVKMFNDFIAMQCTSCQRTIVTCNHFKTPDSGTQSTLVFLLSDDYNIQANTFDGSKTGSYSINTSGSLGAGIVYGNNIQASVSLMPADDVTGTGNRAY